MRDRPTVHHSRLVENVAGFVGYPGHGVDGSTCTASLVGSGRPAGTIELLWPMRDDGVNILHQVGRCKSIIRR